MLVAYGSMPRIHEMLSVFRTQQSAIWIRQNLFFWEFQKGSMLVTRSSMPRMHELIFHLTAERNNLSNKVSR